MFPMGLCSDKYFPDQIHADYLPKCEILDVSEFKMTIKDIREIRQIVSGIFPPSRQTTYKTECFNQWEQDI